MRSSEMCQLKWNGFQTNVTSSFQEFKQNLEFADVTLACEGNQRIEAHKVMLSSGSSLFKTLLTENKHPNPLIYLRGIKLKDLVSVVDFIYNGEVSVYKEDLNDFLEVAEEFKLKGLSQNASNSEDIKDEPIPTEHKAEEFRQSVESEAEIVMEAAKPTEDKELQFKEDNADLDDRIHSMLENVNGVWRCGACGKTAAHNVRHNLKKHIETHLEGFSHSCNHCHKICKTRNALQIHMTRNHKI
jgi:hypothetical protein